MYNKVVMVGNLTRDIDLKYIPSGAAIAKSAIATSYKYKSSSGEKKEEVCFLDFNIFGRSAEVANQYLRKGSKVLLEGRLVLEQWTGQDGNNRSKHSLRVDTMTMLDSKSDAQNNSGNSSDYGQQNASAYNQGQQPNNNYGNAHASGGMAQAASTQASHAIPEIDIDEDEIPF